MQKFEKYMSIIDRKKQAHKYLGEIVTIGIDRPIGTPHPKHNHILYPINYGFIPNVLGGDNEELDVYLLGVDEIVSEYEVRIIAIVHRHNDEEDKLVAAPANMMFTREEIIKQINFQEQFYNTHIELIDDFKFSNVKNITDGFSHDIKYSADFNDQKVFVKECSTKSVYHHLFLANVLSELASKNFSMPKLLNVDYSEKRIRSTYEYIDGEMLEAVINNYSLSEQYELGYKAGVMLRDIHSVKSTNMLEIKSFKEVYASKIERIIQKYKESDLSNDKIDCLIEYIVENKHLINDQPMTFQHGDYHISNMIIKDNDLYIIDFDRYDILDPWEEFNRIVFSASISESFAKGQIDGYFNEDVPANFWPLLKLYISLNVIASQSWAINNDSVEFMHRQLLDTFKWYDNYTKMIPSFYTNKEKE